MPPIAGQVDWGSGTRQVQATSAEIALGSTIAFIDTGTGNTVATALTSPTGQFDLELGSFVPGVGPYYLEADKGLEQGGAQNRAGAPLARLRTLVSFKGQWVSLSAGQITLSKSTTALAALSDLLGLTSAQELGLLGTLDLGKAGPTIDGITPPDSFAGTPAITVAQYTDTWDLVSAALAQDSDPIAALFARPTTAGSGLGTTLGAAVEARSGLGMAQDGWALASLTPASVASTSATPVVVTGLGLPAATDSLTVSLAGVTCPVATSSADGTGFT
ncbi:MAG: hypothetical protein KGR26_14855, partial [Cyanobacteria bacterium REEB65]|nr:hypothetical protein [Cyanobacteria bacterium REEB65]